MDDKPTPSKPGEDKAHPKVTKNFREWADILSAALSVMAFLSGILSFFDFISVAQNLPPLIVGAISGIFSLGVILYSVVFLYQRQQKQRKMIEDELRKHEQKFLDQVNSGFSLLLEEKVG